MLYNTRKGLATYNVVMRMPEFYDHHCKLDDGVLIPLILDFWHIIFNMAICWLRAQLTLSGLCRR